MDTLEIVEILESKGFDKKQSIKLAEAINGKSGLATKEDLHLLESVLKDDISKVETGLKEDIGLLRQDLNKVESSLKQDIAGLKTSNKWIVSVLILILSLLVKMTFF